jgi:hypothetical protein
MPARDETLRVIECVQDLVHCPRVTLYGDSRSVAVPLRLLEELEDSYNKWLLTKRN